MTSPVYFYSNIMFRRTWVSRMFSRYCRLNTVWSKNLVGVCKNVSWNLGGNIFETLTMDQTYVNNEIGIKKRVGTRNCGCADNGLLGFRREL